MSIGLLKLCDPEGYYDGFIKDNCFADGRPIDGFPAISYMVGSYGGVGSSVVRQGEVSVICRVNAEISLVNDGPLIQAEFENKSELKERVVNEVMDVLNDILSLEALIPRSSFICRGTEDSVPLTWKLTLNLQVLNSSGSIIDAAIGAVVYALSNVKLPHIKLAHARDDEAPIEKSEISILAEKSPLVIKDLPVCSTFALYETTSLDVQKSAVLCDPPADMVPFCRTTCTVVAGKNRILAFKLRGSMEDTGLLLSIFDMAMGRQAAVAKSLNL